MLNPNLVAWWITIRIQIRNTMRIQIQYTITLQSVTAQKTGDEWHTAPKTNVTEWHTAPPADVTEWHINPFTANHDYCRF